MTLILDIYNKMPQIVQSLMLNMYGVKTQSRRKMSKLLLNKVSFTEYMTVDEQKKYVSNKIRKILIHTIKTVPRYSNLQYLLTHLYDYQSDPFHILLEFPKTTREEILSNPFPFLSNNPGTKKILKTVTSGTTGTPFTTWIDKGAFNISNALGLRRNFWAGYRLNDWIARLVGDPIAPLGVKSKEKTWRISYTDKRIYLSTFHLNRHTAIDYAHVLNKVKPRFIMGYPSSLEIFSNYLKDSGIKIDWKPHAIFYSSEPLYEHQKNIIKKVIHAPLRGFYGSAERIVSASQCENGFYHLSLIDGFVEGQFDNLTSTQPAIMTTLINYAMPLIRFRLGDVIRFKPNTICSCGRTLPIIDAVVTKQEDWIETPSGRKISPSALTWAFKDVKGIHRSQIVQISKDRVEIHLETDDKNFKVIKPILKERLNKFFFNELYIDCIKNNNIEITKAGKTRFVVRKL